MTQFPKKNTMWNFALKKPFYHNYFRLRIYKLINFVTFYLSKYACLVLQTTSFIPIMGMCFYTTLYINAVIKNKIERVLEKEKTEAQCEINFCSLLLL